MEFYVLVLVCFIRGFNEIAEARYDGVRRMDLYYDYWKHQDVVQAFNTSKAYFLYGYNYQTSVKPYVEENPSALNIDKKCISFKKDDLTPTDVKFTRRYEEGEQEKSDQWYGKFYNGPAIDQTNTRIPIRATANIVEIRKQDGKKEATNYTLMYADYKYCSIFREGISDEYKETKCVVLLIGSYAKKGVLPIGCQGFYNNACGEKDTLKIVFDKSCKTDENLLGC